MALGDFHAVRHNTGITKTSKLYHYYDYYYDYYYYDHRKYWASI